MLSVLLALMVLHAHWTPSRGISEAGWRRLSRVRPLTIVLFVLFVAALAALVAYAETEGLMLAVPAGAHGLAFFAAIDVGACAEVMAVAWLLGAGGVLRTAAPSLRTAMLRSRHRPGPVRARRAPRVSTPRRPRTTLFDEDEPAAWGFPAALAA